MHISQAFAAVRGGLPALLVAGGVAQDAEQLLGILSDDVMALYLECRPALGQGPVDLLTCTLSHASPFAETEAWSQPGPAPAVQLVERIQTLRSNPESALGLAAPLIWLEFDDLQGSTAARPSVCVCIEPSYLGEQRLRRRVPDLWSAAVQELSALEPAGLNGCEVVLRDCIAALPESARPIHVSMMCAREQAPTKLYLRIAAQEVTSYLATINWPGDLRRIQGFLGWCRSNRENVYLDLSFVDGALQDRLGFAFPCPERGTRFECEVFQRLAQEALDSSRAAEVWEALAGWGKDDPRFGDHGKASWVAHRWVDQKIVYDGEGVELKLYLGVRPLRSVLGFTGG